MDLAQEAQNNKFVENGSKNWVLVNWSTNKVNLDDKRMKINKFRLEKIVLGQVRGDRFFSINIPVRLQVLFQNATVFSFFFSIPLSLRVPCVIYTPLIDLSPPFVYHPGHHLSACPIGHTLCRSVSWDSLGSIVQRFFPHK